jgi:acetyl-CoA C-acetyltransferase
MQDVYLIAGARTPVGVLQGVFSEISAIDLGVVAATGAIERSGVDPSQIDQVVIGNVIQTSKDAIYFARHIALKAGLPIETPALTVNRLCGSGLQAIVSAAQMLQLGEGQIALAGGGENILPATQ